MVGALNLSFDALELPGEPGLTLTVYSAEPGTPDDANLTLLASWVATDAPTTTLETLRRDFAGDIIEPGGAEYQSASRSVSASGNPAQVSVRAVRRDKQHVVDVSRRRIGLCDGRRGVSTR